MADAKTHGGLGTNGGGDMVHTPGIRSPGRRRSTPHWPRRTTDSPSTSASSATRRGGPTPRPTEAGRRVAGPAPPGRHGAVGAARAVERPQPRHRSTAAAPGPVPSASRAASVVFVNFATSAVRVTSPRRPRGHRARSPPSRRSAAACAGPTRSAGPGRGLVRLEEFTGEARRRRRGRRRPARRLGPPKRATPCGN